MSICCWKEERLVKKIAFVIRHLYGGGAERVTAALANELCKNKDYEIHIVMLSGRESSEYYLDSNVICHSMEITPSGRIKGIIAKIPKK